MGGSGLGAVHSGSATVVGVLLAVGVVVEEAMALAGVAAALRLAVSILV